MASHVEFAQFAGEFAESLSFNRSLGQIFGLLFVSAKPLSLDEIAQQLSMSKGNASINLRVLEQWGAARPVSISGSRRDHYEAARDLKQVAMRRLQEGISRRLDFAEARLARLPDSPDGALARKRVQELKSLIAKARRALKLLPQVMRFL